jgi:hypothetical protein
MKGAYVDPFGYLPKFVYLYPTASDLHTYLPCFFQCSVRHIYLGPLYYAATSIIPTLRSRIPPSNS